MEQCSFSLQHQTKTSLNVCQTAHHLWPRSDGLLRVMKMQRIELCIINTHCYVGMSCAVAQHPQTQQLQPETCHWQQQLCRAAPARRGSSDIGNNRLKKIKATKSTRLDGSNERPPSPCTPPDSATTGICRHYLNGYCRKGNKC